MTDFEENLTGEALEKDAAGSKKNLTVDEIMSMRHTRVNIEACGFEYPPPKGWRKQLLREAKERRKAYDCF